MDCKIYGRPSCLFHTLILGSCLVAITGLKMGWVLISFSGCDTKKISFYFIHTYVYIHIDIHTYIYIYMGVDSIDVMDLTYSNMQFPRILMINKYD